ncbi:hypothetical protein F1C14_11240 [Clostridium perfringens]|nr:hypothetical protein F1C14_11240 [Clostridium perfringens]
MLEDEKIIECEEMGIEFSKKTGKVKSFNPNKFATFTAKNYKLSIIRIRFMYITMAYGIRFLICTYFRN